MNVRISKNVKLLIGTCMMILLVVCSIFLLSKYYKVDFNQKLPISLTIESNDVAIEDVAYQFWLKLMTPYLERSTLPLARLSDMNVHQMQILEGDQNESLVKVTYWVKPQLEKWSIHHNWGDQQDDGTIENIQWIMRIKNTGQNTYTLHMIEEMSEQD
ncbi:hypothetical protein WAK64_07430 [Bacillus spongiae]|uniref:Uncharacterized protein n=1 Tax=Bacillus spongiae TaxID=2683610 RepID=A0ABU8HCL6_9BACI